jgi:hypothetical protein
MMIVWREGRDAKENYPDWCSKTQRNHKRYSGGSYVLHFTNKQFICKKYSEGRGEVTQYLNKIN